MEMLYQQGKKRAIGVSNFLPDRIIDLIIHNKIMPAINQIEVNPFHQQITTQKFLQDNNVQIEAWAPFAEAKNNIFENEILQSIAAKHNKSTAQVILRWLVQKGIVTLAKTTHKERMIENISIFDFELSPEEMKNPPGLAGGLCFYCLPKTEFYSQPRSSMAFTTLLMATM
jgi:diketogulonate reductase-like aldo/keto reductase